MPKVVVTAYNATCNLGQNIQDIWKNCLDAKADLDLFETPDATYPCARIKGDLKFDEQFFSAKEQSRYDRFIHLLASIAPGLLEEGLYQESTRAAVILGHGLGGFPAIESMAHTLKEKGPRRVSPFFVPSFIANMGAYVLAEKFRLKGTNYVTTSACASSAHAMSCAYNEIKLGHLDMVLTGGSEAVHTPLAFAGFQAMKALAKVSDQANINHLSRPFDKTRSGFVMGEGAALIVLESEESALKNKRKILCELSSYGATDDGHHVSAPHPQGLGAQACMEMALERAKLRPKDIGYLNAHGTSTPVGDVAECKAIEQVFKDHAKNDLVISSTKSMTGHLLGAAAALESVFCIEALTKGIIPPTANLKELDEQCQINICGPSALKKDLHHVMNNSFGFGGTNCSLIFSRYE